jgi:hypothetical protein
VRILEHRATNLEHRRSVTSHQALKSSRIVVAHEMIQQLTVGRTRGQHDLPLHPTAADLDPGCIGEPLLDSALAPDFGFNFLRKFGARKPLTGP